MQKYLIVILGPTASGKTALAVQVAKHFQTEVVSADSRQLFKEMNIGTAKPTVEEMEGVKHHFIDSHSIEDNYSIGIYEKEALDVLEKIFKAKDVAVMVGGSGLYIKVVTEGMDEIPDSDPEVKEELNLMVKEGKLPELLDELKKVDPEFYQKIDKSNTHRVIRAVEVFRSTGVPFSQFRTGARKERPFNVIKVGLNWDRQQLYDRIDKRMDQMIEAGLFEEAEKLYPRRDKVALQTVGYKEIFDHLDGKYDKDEAIRLLKRNTRRYAKRQMTWFSRDGEIKWFKPEEDDMIIRYIRKELTIDS